MNKLTQFDGAADMVGCRFCRDIASVAFGLAAVACMIVAAASALTASSYEAQDHRNRLYYQQFREAAAYAAKYAARHRGRMPPDGELENLGTNSEGIWNSLTSSGADNCDGFRKAAQDEFILWFWRGEWSECFSYPSGRTTLSLSNSKSFRQTLSQGLAALLLGLAFALLAFSFRKQNSAETVS